jgi:energy-coupling factor transport system permease protein
VLAVCLERPASLGLLVAVCAAPFAFVRVDPRWARGATLAILAVAWGTVFSQALFYSMLPKTPWLKLGPLVIYWEGLRYGLAQSLRFIALVVAGLALVTTTPLDRLVAALVALRIPHGVAFLAVTAVRFLPDTAREMAAVRSARARRGRPVHHRTPWAWLRLEVALLRPVVARSLRRARTMAESLDARGFDPVGHRPTRTPLQFGVVDAFALGVAVAITVGVAGLRLLFLLYTAELWWSPHLRWAYAIAREWV